MQGPAPHLLPLAPLLRAYLDHGVPGAEELGQLPELGPRVLAVRSARGTWLADEFVTGAPEADFQEALTRFYEVCVEPPLHAELLRRRAGLVRHALSHLLFCR